MHNLSKLEQKQLVAWEESSKQGQLNLWILLSLKHGPKHMSQVRIFIEDASGGIITAEDNSLYRALRRYRQQKLITHYLQASPNGGPHHKIYKLTESGHAVLAAYLERNIIIPFYNAKLRRLIMRP